MLKSLSAFLLTLLVVPTALATTWSFSDVITDVSSPDYTYYNDAIFWTLDEGITEGYSNGMWGPSDCVTRAETLKMMVEWEDTQMSSDEELVVVMDGETSFTDVNSDDWFYDYVLQYENAGIVQGYSDDTFRPNNCVNRAEAMKIAVETMANIALPETTPMEPLFYDNKLVTDVDAWSWYGPYASLLFDYRSVGTFHTVIDSAVYPTVYGIKYFPADPMTRAELAEMMMNISLDLNEGRAST